MFKHNLFKFASTAILAAAAASPALAQSHSDAPKHDTAKEIRETGDDPYRADNNDWIALSGAVSNATVDGFNLDYGDGLVYVEMDGDGDWSDAHAIADGQMVSVTGRIDDDLFELTSIEASSVYVDGLNRFFYASPADEETFPTYATYAAPIQGDTVLRGVVTDVDRDEGEFIVDTGVYEFQVDTDELAYDPLDTEGYQQIKVDDRVSVTGSFDVGFLERQELIADSIVTF